MCLNPITISNPCKSIAVRGGQQLRMHVKCNKCAHCLAGKRNEYSFRTYWHTKDTIDNGGYVLFDTLTYSDDYLPKISHFIDINKYGLDDFSCFERRHYKLFFKRLRRRIENKYKLNNAISYFFCTEYGDNDEYTHRPHYHFLLFVKTKRIHPLWLSRTISECWPYGRTDGIKYKPIEHVAYHTYGYDFGFGSNNSTYILRAVTHYVSKYINKSIKFQKEIDKRIDKLELALSTEDYPEERIKSLKSQISMFHQQSQGYGLAYLNHLDEEAAELLKTDQCIIPDKDHVKKTFQLPTYYIRKLYYTVEKRSDDTRYWQLTPAGIEHKVSRMIQRIDDTIEEYKQLLSQIPSNYKEHFYTLLNNRTLYDLAVYSIFYYGRLRSHSALNYYTQVASLDLADNELLDTVWLDTIKNSFNNNHLSTEFIHICNEKKDVYINNYFGDILFDVDNEYPCFVHDKKEFINKYTFNQTSCPHFKNFDTLLSYISFLKRYVNNNQQITYDYKQELSGKMKAFTHVTYN